MTKCVVHRPGFRFGDIAGFFETGDFDIMIPVKGDISRVVMKSSQAETELWNRDAGFVLQSEQYGVFVRLEQNDVYAVTMSYEGFSGGPACPDGMAWESGQFLFMDNDIMMVAKDTGAPVPFIVTVRGADGTVLAEGNFQFEVEQEKLFLTFTADGKIEETYIPKNKIFDVMAEIRAITIPAPVALGQVILPDAAHTGVAVIAAKAVDAAE